MFLSRGDGETELVLNAFVYCSGIAIGDTSGGIGEFDDTCLRDSLLFAVGFLYTFI